MKNNYIYGKNTVLNALDASFKIKDIYLVKEFKDLRIERLIKEKNFNVKYMNSGELKNLVGNVNHQGIVAKVEEYSFLSLDDIINKNKNLKLITNIEKKYFVQQIEIYY